MRFEHDGMESRLARWTKVVIATLAVVVPVSVALTFLAFEVSSQPRFCGSCHIMVPYYDSWRASSHNGIACVECHIPPGITSEFQKKYEALSMVAQYFTGTYSTNPWTEVDDRSCLRSGCHTTRVLLGRKLFHSVLFDHQPHLAEMRGSKQLRCTSCHSQIVQGSHITVTAGSCFLCHFKDIRPNTGTARCTLCHTVPEKTITTAGLSFDHGDVKRFDMDCMACHEGVVKGDGDVPRERCLTCHNEERLLRRYGETEFLHRMHVTEHKVECLDCHIEIVHRVPAREEALATPCQSCHSPGAGHAAVRDLYRGIGAHNVAPQPAAMYLAGIRCEACHNATHAEIGRASDVSCMSCHGPASLTIYRTWRAGLTPRLEGSKRELQEAKRRIEEKQGGTGAGVLADAETNVHLLEQGRAIHNPGYAVAILDGVRLSVAAALAAVGESPPRTPPWLQAPYDAECLKCHFGIEYLSEPAFGRPFPHANHVVNARLRCTTCHYGLDRHGSLKVTADDCERCHERITRPMTDVAAEECLACHTAAIGKVSTKVNFPHETHIASGVDCTLCHTGVEDTPHKVFAHAATALPTLGHEFCATCHGGDVPAADGVPPEGADCTKCHVEF